MKITIYAIICPLTEKVKYVGKTVNLKRRIYQHTCKSANFKNRHLSNWINKLNSENGLKPTFITLEECEESVWQLREMYWINHYSSISNLCNHTKGGEGCHGRKMSERLKLKISLAHKGKKKNYKCVGGVKQHTQETKNRISNSKKGKSIAGKNITLTKNNGEILVFKSLKEASSTTGLSVSVISNNLTNRSKSTKLGLWNYKIT